MILPERIAYLGLVTKRRGSSRSTAASTGTLPLETGLPGAGGELFDLSAVRAKKRLDDYQTKIARVLDANRRAIGRLYGSGALFTRAGTRAGRDLLLAHQHLLRVVSLLDRLSDGGHIPAPRTQLQILAVYAELDQLLERTSELTARSGSYLARPRGE